MNADLLKGQVAIVSGGGRGIGRAVSLRLAELGGCVYVNYSKSAKEAEDVVREINSKLAEGQRPSVAIQFDVSKSEEVDRAFAKVLEEAGRLDILVNNAGVSLDSLLIRAKDADWERTIGINLTGAFNCCRAAAKPMMKGRSGRIINISSVIGEMGNAGQAAYTASKAGLIGLTKSVAKELGSRSITVNAVTPGYIVTDMTSGLTDDRKAEILASVPLGRLGEVSDISEVVAFLCGPGGSYITGQVIGVNGGMYI